MEKPPRDARYAKLEERDLQFFRSVVQEGSVVTDPDALAPLNEDWLRKYHGHSKYVFSLSLVTQIKQKANKYKLKL
jgi:D-lactate dehydrogenase (cytochrome)